MNRALTATIGLVAAAFAFPCYAAGTYSCVVKTSRTIDGVTQSSTVFVWGDGALKWRLRETTGGRTMLSINNGPDFWSVNVAKKTAIHAHQQAGGLRFMRSHARIAGDDLDTFLMAGGKAAGQETIEGVRCDVYRLVDKDGLHHALYVIPGQNHLTKRKSAEGTVHAAVKFGDPMGNHRIARVTIYEEWQVGKPIPESMFRPPAGVKIKEAKPVLPPGHPAIRKK